MKKIAVVLITILLAACNRGNNNQELLGTWNCISQYDFNKEVLDMPEGDERLVVEFRPDQLLYWDTADEKADTVAYEINNNSDSILIKYFSPILIRKLDNDSLIVEFDHLKLTFINTSH